GLAAPRRRAPGDDTAVGVGTGVVCRKSTRDRNFRREKSVSGLLRNVLAADGAGDNPVVHTRGDAMRNLMKATGHGLKHFFGARDSVADYKKMGQAVSDGNKVTKAKVMALMGMYTGYKGSPSGLGRNSGDSIKVGRWKYADVKRHQGNVEELLAGTNMSDEGKRAVTALMMH